MKFPFAFIVMRLFGRFSRLRPLGTLLTSGRNRSRLVAQSVSLFSSPGPDTLVSALNDKGVAFGLSLPRALVDEILEYATKTSFVVNRRSAQPEQYVTLDSYESWCAKRNVNPIVGNYMSPSDCPAIKKVIEDPIIHEVARRYFGREPLFVGANMWWSFPTIASFHERSTASQVFHFDLDDFRFLKVFFYLTDVDATSGPHICVEGTHVRKRFIHQLLMKRLTDDETEASYGKGSVRMICLPAGSGFIEDTFCYHKGQAPTSSRRLLLEFQFALTDFNYTELASALH
jgi:hypothetical protein